ncbi:MAG: elongation factor G [Actinomycetota bacterium]|nr:elongation factor G [Actinomycetota bacterium]
MSRITPERIRNIVLVGHGGAGKTTLAEAMLFRAGAVNRIGRVEDGSTVLDSDPEERERGSSLSLALAQFEWRDHKINLIDTPGFPDFIGEVRAALRVADMAVFVVSAVEGVEVQTEMIWRMAEELSVPRMVFVNKLDRERASFERTLDDLRERFGAGVAPLELPIGIESSFHGVADLLTDRAFLYDDGNRSEADIPDEMEELEHRVHDNLVEGIVVADDALCERYLEGEKISLEQLEKTLTAGIIDASVFPVVCGSATGPIAVDRLLDLVCEVGPSPIDRPGDTVIAAGEEITVAPDPNGEPLAFVFRTIADPYVGHVSLFKVISGVVNADDQLVNTRSSVVERLHGISSLRGSEQTPVDQVVLGDIAAVAKLNDTMSGDTLAPRNKPVVVPPIRWPEPVLWSGIVARTQADDDKLADALHRLLDEDPTLRLERNDETHQMILGGLGETHLRISLERLQRKFGVGVDTEDVRIAYRETITSAAEAEGKHKKQSGGRGQYGVAFLRVEPLERGGGFEFVDAIVGGAIPRQFIPAVEKGIAETMESGGVLGFPVVDVRVTCYDGKYHSVDSDEMSFKMAGRLGFRAACENADPVLLEPVSRLEVTVPSEQQGDVMGDLNARRGRVQGTDTAPGGEQTIIATVPAAELLRYAIDLRSISGGRGRFTVAHDHYDTVPTNLVDKILAAQEE